MSKPKPDVPDDQATTDGALIVFGAIIVLALLLCVMMFLIAS